MSDIVSWLGNPSYGVAGLRVREANQFAFTPTDISGLQLWMDANDGFAVNANEFGTVLSWHNKGDLSGNFDLSGTADVRYGDNFVNGLNVVTFNADAFMTGTFALNFQDRSIFIVSKRNTDISGGVFTWLTSDTADGMETGISNSGSNFTYLVSKHPGFSVELGFTTTTDTKGYAELATFTNSSTDLSGNYGALNSTQQSLVASQLASYETASIGYFLGNYFGGSTLANDYDLCELIIYDTVLSATDITRVQEYLTAKWAIVDPPPPPPVPFSPDDIAGLQVWLDGSNAGSFSLSGTDILSWNNSGSAGGSFVQGSNIATLSNSVVEMNTGATLDAYFSIPYYSRTMFNVFECKSDLSTITYPYINMPTTSASDGRQQGISWDSNTSNYLYTVCQAGTNCPIAAPFNALPSGLNLVYGVVDSNSYTSSFAYLNNSSNLNTSTDLGNLFNQNPIPFTLGSDNIDSPAFRLAEFIEYDTVLSDSNISTVKSYLSDKWGLNL